jgi:hypothetical protein
MMPVRFTGWFPCRLAERVLDAAGVDGVAGFMPRPVRDVGDEKLEIVWADGFGHHSLQQRSDPTHEINFALYVVVSDVVGFA